MLFSRRPLTVIATFLKPSVSPKPRISINWLNHDDLDNHLNNGNDLDNEDDDDEEDDDYDDDDDDDDDRPPLSLSTQFL